ncbi:MULTISPECIES: YneF family protein [unclassified Gemella]|uniref:YneF family protein n=1 Tax=unclassified Gemella TaxID=2624949 RepID=UPI0010745FA8|nr:MULTISPECIES: YneF family protein [unclassified Gemella]MBF0746210.1 YneF family protein [Gemella sp. 19428wG2_WT2a]MBF0847457.1 YneF family protein [Streptococcus danieliae]TFU60494.1 YneF family protein [Gemella sp. WT2a]MBF0710131.1 YneF family protein [Gemella sp. GL1.1]NYS27475.1 YneF family protein [Gemella sp. GL1]
MSTGIVILIATVTFLLGLVAGFFIARKNFMNYMENNPQLNEDVMMSMLSQMGQKPSKKKINQMMSNMQKAQKQALKGKK